MLVCLLFAQAAIATSGCLMTNSGLDAVISVADRSDCAGSGTMNANLCLAHCSASDQSVGTTSLALAVPTSLAPVLLAARTEPHFIPELCAARIERATDPPIPIRFCSYLI